MNGRALLRCTSVSSNSLRVGGERKDYLRCGTKSKICRFRSQCERPSLLTGFLQKERELGTILKPTVEIESYYIKLHIMQHYRRPLSSCSYRNPIVCGECVTPKSELIRAEKLQPRSRKRDCTTDTET